MSRSPVEASSGERSVPETTETGVLDRLAGFGVIPVVELESVAQAPPLIGALVEAGLGVVEITLRSEAGLAAIEAVRSTRDDVLVGAGTVRTADAAARAIDAGAQFVVSPSTNPEVIAMGRSQGVLVLPGACTPTEVDLAVRSGASVVKFFPAAAMGGVAFLEALRGPFREVSFVPTGGINAANLAEYLALPQVLACGGSWMVARALLAEGRFDLVESLAREAVAIVAEARAKASQRGTLA